MTMGENAITGISKLISIVALNDNHSRVESEEFKLTKYAPVWQIKNR
jgi:hypothetical protein